MDVGSTKPVISVMSKTPRSMRQSDTKRGSQTVIWLMTLVRNSMTAVYLLQAIHYTDFAISEDQRTIANKLAREEKVYWIKWMWLFYG